MRKDATEIQFGNDFPTQATLRMRRSTLAQPGSVGAPIRAPEKPDSRKTVWFDPPRSVICSFELSTVRVRCFILGIWDGGATLRVHDPRLFAEFDLLFGSDRRPVWRRCQLLAVRGNVIDVEFKLATPQYSLRPQGECR